jgi:hypothetical protein
MAKLSIQRLLEVSKLVATDAGQQLQEALTFLNDVSDQVLRALRNGLTFQDNFNCLVTESTLKHDTETQISTSGKRPSGVIPLRVLSTSSGIDGITWFLNNQGQLTVKIKFTDAPTESRKVQLLILFE